MSIWRALRTIHKLLLWPETVRIDWHKAFTGRPNPNPRPDWNIYDAFAKYVAVPMAMLITIGMVPYFMFRGFTDWFGRLDDETKIEYALLVCAAHLCLPGIDLIMRANARGARQAGGRAHRDRAGEHGWDVLHRRHPQQPS